MFMTPWKSLAPWVLLLVQESYLLYINSDYKNLGYRIYTIILKSHMEATLDATIGENQSAAIKCNNITYIFHQSTSNWCLTSVKQQSCLNIFELFWIFRMVDWDFTAFVSLFYHKFVIRKFILPFLSLVMETFIHKIEVAYTNIKSKTKKMVSYLKPLPLYEEFARGVHCYMLLWLRYLPFLLMLIQGLQEYK